MKQEQLKLLAEWGYKKGATLLPPSTNEDYLNVQEKPSMMGGWIKFRPHIDSNQLDMLEDKMLLEVTQHGVVNIIYWYRKYSGKYMWKYSCAGYIEGEGETKNEARLNAITQYVEGLK